MEPLDGGASRQAPIAAVPWPRQLLTRLRKGLQAVITGPIPRCPHCNIVMSENGFDLKYSAYYRIYGHQLWRCPSCGKRVETGYSNFLGLS